MYTQKDKTKENVAQVAVNSVVQKNSSIHPSQALIQRAYNYGGLLVANKDNTRDLAKGRKLNTEFNPTGMSHNYALDIDNRANWARSADNRHSEHLVAMRRITGVTLNLLTERKPCGLCEADLRAFGDDPIANNTVNTYSLISEDGGNGNKLKEIYEGVWGSVKANTDLT